MRLILRPGYSAIIRTYNSAPLVYKVIEALRAQTQPPVAIIVVDSGSGARDIAELRAVVDKVVDISRETFNYSRAINVGVAECETSNVLIISSHLLLNDSMVMAEFLDELHASKAEVGFMISKEEVDWVCRKVDAGSFDGTNGLTNSCSFLPVSLVMELPFREEVFSAEDQEWTARYLGRSPSRMVGVSTRRISYLNPRFSYAKKLNEELALAYFVDRKRLGIGRIGLWLAKALWSLFKQDVSKAKFRMSVAKGLLQARRIAPNRSSRYF